MLPAGSPGLDLYKVVNADEAAIAELLKETKSLRKSIEKREIHFASNEPLPAAGQDDVLDKLAGDIKELAAGRAVLSDFCPGQRTPCRVSRRFAEY